MSDHDTFLSRADVSEALDELVQLRLRLTDEGRDDSELPDAMTYLGERGIDIPERTNVRLLRTVHETDLEALHETDIEAFAPLCDGERAVPVNCERIGGRLVCDWVCP